MRLVRCLIALAAIALVVPATASAATVAVVNGKPTFTAASGESNRLTVRNVAGGVEFEDTGITSMTAGAGCLALQGQRARCLLVVLPPVVADLGDGNDWVAVDLLAIPATVYGGLGNDSLRGGAADDTIDGGPGNDVIDGLWGDDLLVGAEGADSLSGNLGRDRVSYADRTAAVTVSLDGVANDGASGEGDNVTVSVDHVTGGAGNDVLTGDEDANELLGGGGDDTLDGAAGDDVLDGGAGTDGLSGGAGIDNLRARDGVQESLACGTEPDIAEADHNDSADADCEVVNRDLAPPLPELPPVVQPELPPPPTGGTGNVIEAPVATIPSAPIDVSDGGVMAVRLKCPSEAFQGCAGSIDVEELAAAGSNAQPITAARRRKLASRRFKVAAGRSATIPVRMDRRSWRSFSKKLRKRRRVKVQVTVTMENATGTTTNTRIVTLRRQPSKKKKRRTRRRMVVAAGR